MGSFSQLRAHANPAEWWTRWPRWPSLSPAERRGRQPGAEGGGQALPRSTPSVPPTPRLTAPTLPQGRQVLSLAVRTTWPATILSSTDNAVRRQTGETRRLVLRKELHLFLSWTHTAQGLGPKTRFRTSGSWGHYIGVEITEQGPGRATQPRRCKPQGTSGDRQPQGRQAQEEATACCSEEQHGHPDHASPALTHTRPQGRGPGCVPVCACVWW